MTPDQFEQLISAWLDAEDPAPLEKRLRAAAESDPQLATLWAQHRRLADHLGRWGARLPAVDWDTTPAARVGQVGVDPEQREKSTSRPNLDEALAHLPDVTDRVDWQRFGGRVAGRVYALAAVKRRNRFVLRAAISLTAAAAAVVLLVTPWRIGDVSLSTERGATEKSSRARVRVHDADMFNAVATPQPTRRGVARISITPAPSDSGAPVAADDAAEVFVLVSPPDSSSVSGAGGAFGIY